VAHCKEYFFRRTDGFVMSNRLYIL
jgi:hypothetical protein